VEEAEKGGKSEKNINYSLLDGDSITPVKMAKRK